LFFAAEGYAPAMSNPNEERERLADEAMGRDPDKDDPSPGEPWAKVGSGDKDNVTPDDDD
jgi:hypothetical protein